MSAKKKVRFVCLFRHIRKFAAYHGYVDRPHKLIFTMVNNLVSFEWQLITVLPLSKKFSHPVEPDFTVIMLIPKELEYFNTVD